MGEKIKKKEMSVKGGYHERVENTVYLCKVGQSYLKTSQFLILI